MIALISDLLAGPDGLERTFHELRAFVAHGHDVVLLQVRDPEEEALELRGSFRFVDPETRARRDASVAEVALLYARRAREFARSVRELARAARIDLALAATDGSPVAPLSAIVATRHRVARSGSAHR